MKIKKNGRNGQSQSGVDVYGIPKGETGYWGIQCKGKDEYTDAKLTKLEIDNEIAKAKLFSPKLDVFIFATTMSKSVEIEEYIRERDLESRRNGEFEILLFCWEDISDLIDENQDTYNFWVANKLHKTKFDFEVSLNDFRSEFIIKPKCIRTIKRYRLKEPTDDEIDMGIVPSSQRALWIKSLSTSELFSAAQTRVNEAICPFEVIMANTGAAVIEDWRVIFTVRGAHREILDQLGTGPMGMIDIGFLRNKRTYIEGNRIFFSPGDNEPLIQKDNRYFEAYIIPECREYTVSVEWELLARDFSSNGTVTLVVLPTYEDQIIFEDVISEVELKADEVIAVEEKKNYKD